jgi:hypothetical protein
MYAQYFLIQVLDTFRELNKQQRKGVGGKGR